MRGYTYKQIAEQAGVSLGHIAKIVCILSIEPKFKHAENYYEIQRYCTKSQKDEIIQYIKTHHKNIEPIV